MPIPLVIAGAAIAAKAGSAYLQGQAAKRNAERLAANRPFLPESTAARDQQALAENEMQRGEATAGNNAYTQASDRDFATSLNTILKNGADVNDVGALFDGSDQGRQKARLMTENIRLNNIDRTVRAYQNSDQARQQAFQFNQWGPWADATQANALARKQSADKLWSAVDDAGGLAMRGASGEFNDNTGYYNEPQSSGHGQTISTNYSFGSYAPPSVASKFGTIDPNALNNRF